MIKLLSISFLMIHLLLIGQEEEIAPVKLVDQIMASYMNDQTIPGMAVALVIDGQSYLLNYGLANKDKQTKVSEDTIFEIASVTKVFTATELALEVLKGRMNLNDSVKRFLPALKANNDAINRVTLQELATHTSSLPRVTPHTSIMGLVERRRIINFLNTWEPEYPIGTHYLYSNLGFGILGIVLENVEHRSYQQLLEMDILKPLEMHSTMVRVPESMMDRYALGYSKEGAPLKRHNTQPLTPAAGALKSTSKDMLQFLLANLGIKGPEELLNAMKLSQQPQFKVNEHLTIGLGWQILHPNNVLTIDKNGGLPGFSSYIGFIPKQNIGIVILVNKAHTAPTQIGRQVLKRLAQLPQKAEIQIR